MGSTGSGNFSDYPGNRNAVPGLTGGESMTDICERAINTRLEDVATSGYYQQNGQVPSVGTSVVISFATRIVATDNQGVIIGNLPTEYNYLYRCLDVGYHYEGQVIGSYNSPFPSVQIAVTPKLIK